MMGRDRLSVLAAMMEQGVIPVFHHPDPEVCIRVVQACAAGGARCVEFTDRGDFAAQVFAGVSRHFAEAGPAVILGAGTVVDAPTAALYISNGARFVVGPTLSAEVARLCNRRAIAYCPGCGSATEIGDAQELGCEIVKIFPGGSVGGPGFVRSVLGPMPWTRIMPTGGVEPTEESLREWFEAGIVACGIGSRLIRKELLDAGDFAAVARDVRKAVDLIGRIRAELTAALPARRASGAARADRRRRGTRRRG